MSSFAQGTPRRGGVLARRPSNTSIVTVNNVADETKVTHAFSGDTRPAQPIERKCVLWVHDEAFSKEDVVFNLSLLPPDSVRLGQLMSIIALKTSTAFREFQDKTALPKKGADGLAASLQFDSNVSELKSSRGGLNPEGQYEVHVGRQYLFAVEDMSKDMKAKHPNLEISVAKSIADAFGFKHRSNILLTTANVAITTASHVELTFKDEYLARSDMWRLTLSELSNKTVYKGQKIIFMGTIKAQVTTVYVAGRKVQSAFFSINTKPIFRSASARYVLFIQMSKEMWDFDSEGSGEIMFTKVVNGFLPALFKRWVALKARHLVSIVLFTRMEYDIGLTQDMDTGSQEDTYYTGIRDSGARKPYKDFYRVVVSEMASGEWTTILYQLNREFRIFRRDVSMHRLNTTDQPAKDPSVADLGMGSVPGTRIEAEPTFALHGNILEAINLASTQFSQDHIDRDLIRTGISIVVISPGTGLFEVDYETLRTTTETLIGSGIGIDLVCLPKMPLHSVPLFRYRNPQYISYQESLRIKAIGSESSTPRQGSTVVGSFSSMHESLSPSKASSHELHQRLGLIAPNVAPEEWSFAIPHWLDVSFWTGASQELLSRPGAKLPKVARRRHGILRPLPEFAVRCKMWEVEMLGAILNDEISIASLPQHLQRPPLVQQLGSSHSTLPHKKRKRHAGLTELIHGPTRPVIDKRSTRAEVEFYESLEAYDEKAIVYSSMLKAGQSKADTRKQPKVNGEKSVKAVLAEDPKLFGTSFNESNEKPDVLSLVGPTLSKRSKPDPTDGSYHKRNDSVSTISSNSTLLPSRPSKVLRQISLGYRGFGIAAPKAAVAELHTENANAAKTPSKKLHGLNAQASSSSAMANHLLASPRSEKLSDRPSSSQGSLRSTKESQRLLELTASEYPEKVPTSRPIAIKSMLQVPESIPHSKARSILGSFYEGIDLEEEEDGIAALQKIKTNDTVRASKAKLLAGAVPDVSASSSTTSLSPWLKVLNPSNPTAANNTASQYKRWQHVFPRPLKTKAMKWKSLCSPASVPLTTEYFPTKHQLDTEFQQMPYNISQNTIDEDLNEVPKTREEFIRELISLRLSQGFQIVVGPAVAEAFGQKLLKIANAFDCDQIAIDGASIFMSMGNLIHQLSCVNGTEVEVNVFVRKMAVATESTGKDQLRIYQPSVRTTLEANYEPRSFVLNTSPVEYNWNYVDSYIAGHDEEMSDGLRYWRARYVLIPVERPSFAHHSQGQDTEEEIRLEGIKTLTQIWQRYRYIPPSERSFQNLASRKRKDANPLDINYQTQDPSVVVLAEIENLQLLENGEAPLRRGQLLSEGDRFRKASLNIGALADAIQAPVEKGGVRMQNRRWHFRLHYNCFIGSDMTTWLLENFEDVETREEAVELGNLLMGKDDERKARDKEQVKDFTKDKEVDKDIGIFVHVEKRHPFRDGQYFYQVVGENAKPRPEHRSGWFAPRRRDTSIPSTPRSETTTKESPKPERIRSSSNNDEKTSESGNAATPTNGTVRKTKVTLSKVMKYDVDPRKRSYRTERINLHYDRLHNPDNCYHIRLDWMNVTAKLIEDSIQSWANTAERYGLRLVEVPIGEACSITEIHPFRSPFEVKLIIPPPDQQPPTTFFDATSLVAQASTTKHYYQKAIMKKFNFVLDIEAAHNFPTNVDVTYSWGKPDYRYTQYIHRSGVVLAQITDEGNFLLLANKLYNNRSISVREQDRFIKNDHTLDRNVRSMASVAHGQGIGGSVTPLSSPMMRASMASPMMRATTEVLLSGANGPNLKLMTPESIKTEVEAFCRNSALLECFYKETMEKSVPPANTPNAFHRALQREAMLDANIPVLGLPPGVLTRESSPSPIRLATIAPKKAREEASSLRSGQDSPRGSIISDVLI